ncbi:hypothetical protein SKAU_G00281470 [Synaphobranchus kaupii]|uniref:Uncharacterized protein n=1 Tax=Synaphobranchus kaupii TaxID=118154 RepID=A0A9Q1EX57_SYNKA|nr:hypothetical protein SKAU_G00281470 [Synaphobranchus kaupii]
MRASAQEVMRRRGPKRRSPPPGPLERKARLIAVFPRASLRVRTAYLPENATPQKPTWSRRLTYVFFIFFVAHFYFKKQETKAAAVAAAAAGSERGRFPLKKHERSISRALAAGGPCSLQNIPDQ